MDKEQIARFEKLAQQLYSSDGSAEERKQLFKAALVFGRSAESIGVCQLVLSHSSQEHALFLASASLLKLVTRFFTGFQSSKQTAELRNFLVMWLGTKGVKVNSFVSTSVCQVSRSIGPCTSSSLTVLRRPSSKIVCRIAKFAYSQPEHKDLVKAVSSLFQVPAPVCPASLVASRSPRLAHSADIPTIVLCRLRFRTRSWACVCCRSWCVACVLECAIGCVLALTHCLLALRTAH